MTVVGIDQSATGTAAVALDDRGRLIDQVFYADTKTQAARHRSAGAVEPVKVRAADEIGRTARLEHIRATLARFVAQFQNPTAALEGYAFARQAFVHSLGEVGAVVRLVLWDASIPFRVYDPQAVKIFATNRGNADKEQMIEAVQRKWGLDYMEFGQKPSGAAGNLADAFTIARMVYTELRVRSGEVELKALPEEERRVFLRTTKQQATNVLDQTFAVKEN